MDKFLIDNPNSETCLSTMKVVVDLSAVLPFTGWPLLTGPWLLKSIKLTAFTAGDQTKMDRSFPSCTTEHVHQQRQNGSFRDGLQRSNRVWICCCSLMKSWLIMLFLHKMCTRPIGRLVSQFYSSLGCFYPSGMTGRVVSSNTVYMHKYSFTYFLLIIWASVHVCLASNLHQWYSWSIMYLCNTCQFYGNTRYRVNPSCKCNSGRI